MNRWPLVQETKLREPPIVSHRLHIEGNIYLAETNTLTNTLTQRKNDNAF